MLWKPIAATLGAVLALSLLMPTAASAQRGMHGGAGVRAGAVHGGAFRGGAFRGGGVFRGGRIGLRRGFRAGFGAGFYGWGYPLVDDLYPYPFYYQTVCGYERIPVSIHRKIRWRWIYRCH